VANASAEVVTLPAAIRASLEAQLLSSVRWEATIRRMLAWGAERFIEIGPGKVLSGLVRSIDKAARCEALGDAESVGAWLAGGDKG
jgi:[acyl-carrier-protein] S-malonyltransferase